MHPELASSGADRAYAGVLVDEAKKTLDLTINVVHRPPPASATSSGVYGHAEGEDEAAVVGRDRDLADQFGVGEPAATSATMNRLLQRSEGPDHVGRSQPDDPPPHPATAHGSVRTVDQRLSVNFGLIRRCTSAVTPPG